MHTMQHAVSELIVRMAFTQGARSGWRLRVVGDLMIIDLPASLLQSLPLPRFTY
jgi:hypothetical protein